jgi:uncharacterized protein (TIGR02145 family)
MDFTGTYAYYWSSTEDDSDNAYYLGYSSGGRNTYNYTLKYCGFPVRCVK